MPGPKVKRKISLSIYLTAFVLTVLVFSLGVYIGMVIDESAQNKVEGELLELEEDLYLSRILLLSEEEVGAFCPIYSEKLAGVDSERELIGDRLEYLESVRGLYDEELKQRYYYLEFENYLLMKKMQENCGEDYVLLLFFYDGGGDSKTQGETLDAFRAQNPNVKVFSFDGTSEAAVVDVLKEQYNVSSYPSIVFEGNTLSGSQTLGQLEVELNK